MTILVPTPGGA